MLRSIHHAFPVALAGAAFFIFLPLAARGITFNQVDTFQDGSTMNWREGDPSPNPPVNVASGGPAGAGDRFLENESSGGFGAGSRMLMFNQAQWLGNYNAAGVNRITAQMANFGTTTLHIRIAFRGGSSGTLFGSNTAASLPNDGVWRAVTFDLTASALTNIGGSNTLAQTLDNVTELRIVSAVGGAAFNGDAVSGTLGVDNITATSIPVAPPVVTEFKFVNESPRVSFETLPGKTYRVERNDSLADGNWVVLSNAANIAGTGGVIQVSDPQPGVGSLARRFYRVLLLD